MQNRYRANMESGMIHDLELPCWWALNTRRKLTADFITVEAAETSLQERGVTPVICGRCRQRKTSKKLQAEQNRTAADK